MIANTPPQTMKTKGKIQKKKIIKDNNGDDEELKNKVSQEYQKMELREHVLVRTENYLGSKEHEDMTLFIYNNEFQTNNLPRIIQVKALSFSNALYKLFDEIGVNALDQHILNKSEGKQSDRVTSIKIDIAPVVKAAAGKTKKAAPTAAVPWCITVENNGKGIPIVIHDTQQVYIPVLIFGEMLTSTNYDDTKKRVTGGKNGEGGKVVNIFSRRFKVVTTDSRTKKRLEVEWKDNMTVMSEPIIEKYQKIADMPPTGTSVAFEPDVSRFPFYSKDQRQLDASILSPRSQLLGQINIRGVKKQQEAVPSHLSMVDLYIKRAYDLAGCLNAFRPAVPRSGAKVPHPVSLILNGEELPIKSFYDYTRFYSESTPKTIVDDQPPPQKLQDQGKYYEYIDRGQRWHFILESVNQLIHTSSQINNHIIVSFVNGVHTMNGGKHEAYILGQIYEYVATQVQKKLNEIDKMNGFVQQKNQSSTSQAAKMPFTMAEFRRNVRFFLFALIENPDFESQVKMELKTPPEKFGSECKLTVRELTSMNNTLGLVELMIQFSLQKRNNELRLDLKHATVVGQGSNAGTDVTLANGTVVTRRKILNIPKLDDANLAGTSQSSETTLILTEGDSAKATAITGVGAIENGRDYYGIFPLRGKLVNVRDNSRFVKNEEIKALIKIIGLSEEVEAAGGYTPETVRTKLRYGSVCFMTDQDLDGSHIKGLLINFFHLLFPSLLRVSGFLKFFITPICKIFPRSSRGAVPLETFYTYEDRNKFIISARDAGTLSKYRIKYYKGLGTSSATEAQEYFQNLSKHLISYHATDAEETDDMILLAFKKTRANDRKGWVNSASIYETKELSYDVDTGMEITSFVRDELIHFSKYDNIRSIPSMIDGLKPSQRKILFIALQQWPSSISDSKEMKVVNLASKVADGTAYHHGEKSLEDTIKNMAQTFVGSNNINYLEPLGQFGTRLVGGKDAASSRYVFTRLNPLIRMIFRPEDTPLLRYLVDDGIKIEPHYFVPILPMIAINGTKGIGTGYAVDAPNHNPLDIIDYIRAILLDDQNTNSSIIPWYYHFRGTVEDNQGEFYTVGKYNRTSPTTIEISELPVGLWTLKYQTKLDKIICANTAKTKASASASADDTKPTTTAAEKKVAKKKQEAARKKFFKNVEGDESEDDDDDDDDSSTSSTSSSGGGGGAVKKQKSMISALKGLVAVTNYNTDTKIHFILQFSDAESVDEVLAQPNVPKALGIISRVKHLLNFFNSSGNITTYETIRETISEYIQIRLEYYDLRKSYLSANYSHNISIIENKLKFLQFMNDDELMKQDKNRIYKKTEQEQEGILESLGLQKLCTKFKWTHPKDRDEIVNAAEEEEDDDTVVKKEEDIEDDSSLSYRYLLSMNYFSSGLRKIQQLEKELESFRDKLEYINNVTSRDIWLQELNEFQVAYLSWKKCQDEIFENLGKIKKNKNSGTKKKLGTKKKITKILN